MFKKILDGYYRFLRIALTVLMFLLIIPVCMQILSRYTGLIPAYIWTEEAARFFFMWIIMIGAMIAVRDGSHFDVDVLPKPKTVRGHGIGKLIVHLIIMAGRPGLRDLRVRLRQMGLHAALGNERNQYAFHIRRLASGRSDLDPVSD